MPIVASGLALVAVSLTAQPLITVPVGVVPYALCAADLDSAPGLEVVVGGLDQDVLVAADTAGRVLWRYETAGMPLAIAPANIDGEGRREIAAIVGKSAPEVIVLDAAGRLLQTIVPEVPVYLLRAADLDGDEADELIVAGYMGRLLVYEGDGTKRLDKLVSPRNFHRQMAGLAVGDVNGDGRVDVAYQGTFQQVAALDLRGGTFNRRGLPSFDGALATCADLDGDGTAELISCSLPKVSAESMSKKRWSVDLRQKGELGAEADGLTKWPYEYGGMRFLVAGNFTNDAGLELASFASDGKFDLLSSTGKRILRTKTKYPFVALAAADLDADGIDEVLLSRLHYKETYVARFDGDLDDIERALRAAMASDRVTEGLDRLLDAIDACPTQRTRARSDDEKLHVLWGIESTLAPELMARTVRAFDRKMRELRCDNVEYAFMFTLKERGVHKFKRDGICAVPPIAPTGERLLDLCRGWERDGIRFYPVVSHMGVPTVMPDTAKRIMQVAPNACQGYLMWETMANYPGEVWYDFLRRTEELARICMRRGKQILFAEESPFWIALVSDPKARAILLKPEYKGVLVPVLKTLQPHGDEAELMAYVGSVLAGEVETWGITGEEDFFPYLLGHYRGCPDDVVMRQELLAVALGARYLMIESGHVYFEPIDAKGKLNPLFPVDTRISREARRERMALELFRKGILGPVRPEDLLSPSSVGFSLSKSPRIDRAKMRWESFGTRMFDGNGLLNMDLTNILFNTGPYSLARNLYGCRKLMNGVFPETPWGLTPIFGPGAAQHQPPGVDTVIETDGELVRGNGEWQSAEQALPKIAAAVELASTKLPFRADGVFCSARRDGRSHYQVLLMDTELFAPEDFETTVTTTISGQSCHDEITGERPEVRGNALRVTVPAGGFRLLRFSAKR